MIFNDFNFIKNKINFIFIIQIFNGIYLLPNKPQKKINTF